VKAGKYLRWQPEEEKSEVPTAFVYRDASTWGFILDSCWYVQTSFPMPNQGENLSLEDAALPTTVDMQHVEAQAYNLGLPLPWPRGVLRSRQGLAGNGAEEEDEDSGITGVVVYAPDGGPITLPSEALATLLQHAAIIVQA